MSVRGCLSCDLIEGRQPLPGGVIHDSGRWLVEHCVGPLGVGTLIVVPRRHVLAVAELESEEASELGPLLRRTAAVAQDLTGAEQVYVCLWSHAGGEPVHIHFVVQPVTAATKNEWGEYGPGLADGDVRPWRHAGRGGGRGIRRRGAASVRPPMTLHELPPERRTLHAVLRDDALG